MGLIALTCPNCGSKLDVEEGKDFYFCSYCGAKVTQEKKSIELSGKVSVSGIATEDSLLDKGYIQLKNREFDSAENTFERVLDINPRRAGAYMGRLLASLHRSTLDSLQYSDKPLRKYYLYQRALDFSNGKEKQQYLDIGEKCEKRLRSEVVLPSSPEVVEEPSMEKFALSCFKSVVVKSVVISIIVATLGSYKFAGLVLVFLIVSAILTGLKMYSSQSTYKEMQMKYNDYLANKQWYENVMADQDTYRKRIVDNM